MPTKTKTTKAARATVKKTATKAKPAAQKAAAKSKSGATTAGKKAPKSGKKKAAGLMQTVKHSVQVGIESVSDLVKKVTPGALMPKTAKTKRR